MILLFLLFLLFLIQGKQSAPPYPDERSVSISLRWNAAVNNQVPGTCEWQCINSGAKSPPLWRKNHHPP
jgi:hypothetical protein